MKVIIDNINNNNNNNNNNNIHNIYNRNNTIFFNKKNKKIIPVK